MAKVKIEHELLDSKIATATALFNEWIKWCVSNNISGYSMAHITDTFKTGGLIPPAKETNSKH